MDDQTRIDEIIDDMRGRLPLTVYRRHDGLRDIIGVAAQTLANLDAAGEGPENKIMLNGKVAYHREDLLRWVRSRMTVVSRCNHDGQD